MQIEDRLDTLLTARLNGTAQGTWLALDEELLPLLQAADALAPLREAQPRAEFARALEIRLLAYAASRGGDSALPTLAGDATEELSTDESPAMTSADPRAHGRTGRRSGRVWRPRQVMAAAALLLIVCASALTTAAASAGPGSLLFGLHRVEQNVRVQLASSQGDRIRLHLSYADEALSQLNAAVAQQAGDPAYSSALATFLMEQRAAVEGLLTLTAGAERNELSTELTDLRLRAQGDLHAALHVIGWPDRLITTQALGELGETVVVVRDVKVTHLNGQNVHLVRLVVSGSGFAPAAVVMVDGRQVGTVTSATATQLVVEIDATALHAPLRVIGVSNPDGTAALSQRTEVDNDANQGGGSNSHPTPVVHPTPTPNGHGHGNGGNGGNRNSG
ncbi:MAG TPA: hypothetical protein VGP82_24840 [Ktedonobacterales bacterium]|nr:hypothetical protein [Ktedonobacterales bacterium]